MDIGALFYSNLGIRLFLRMASQSQSKNFFKALAEESQSLNDGQIESLKQKKQLTEIES